MDELKELKLQLGSMQQTIMILKMIRESPECLEGFTKTYQKTFLDIENNPVTDTGEVLYRGCLRNAIQKLEDLRDQILQEASSRDGSILDYFEGIPK